MDVYENEKRMNKIVLYFQGYVNSYVDMTGFEKINMLEFIDDMLYRIGLSINKEKYQSASGYKEWKEFLLLHLKEKD